MTLPGIVLLDLIGLALLMWTLNLVRRDRLYVAYGAMFVVLIAAAMVILSTPVFFMGITRLMHAVFPASAWALSALGFIVVMLVYILSQLTIISNRLATAVQESAIQRASAAMGRGSASLPTGAETGTEGGTPEREAAGDSQGTIG